MTIKLHAGQSEAYEDMFLNMTNRFGAVCCARGWGKSYFLATAATTAVFELMDLPANVPNKRVAIIAPTYDQVTDIYYPLLVNDFGLDQYAIKSSQDQGRFIFDRNVELRLLSYEAVERMRGKGYYFVGWDEITSCKKGIDPKKAWESVIRPCIVTRWSEANAKRVGARAPGRALIASTPNGYDFFHEMFHFYENDPRWKSYHYDYTGSPFLDPNEIELLKATTDPRTFAAEYMAEFKDSGNSVFYMFDRKIHVNKDIPDFRPPSSKDANDGEDVHVGIDFNVGIQASSIFAIRGTQKHYLDEFMGHPDTETLAIALRARYKGHKIFAYPDPSGRSRKSSAPVGTTDFAILEANGIRCIARSKAPPLVDSVNAVNAQLMNTKEDVNIYFHPRCVKTIESMERTRWVDNNPNTATIEKKEGVEHFSDGIRYAIEYLNPVNYGKKAVHRGFNF
jgi:hypothetical protein